MIEALKKYFEGRQDVAFAFLYGSQAWGRATRMSDVDVAAYFAPRTRHPLEFEDDVHYDAEDEIWSDLQRLLGKEVELLVLNRAPCGVAASAIGGIRLSVKDWALYLEYAEVATRASIDFGEAFVRDYKERNGLEDRSQD
jgi:predicted nucleotidyltransferase